MERHHNYILDQTEPAVESKEQREQRLRLTQLLAYRRQTELDDLFHIDQSFPQQQPDEAKRLKEAFLEAKKGKNLGECFDLSLRKPFFGSVHVVRLASTDHLEPDESLRMFQEMNEFLTWFRNDGPYAHSIAGYDNFVSEVIGDDVVHQKLEEGADPGNHFDRLKSGRWMEYEFYLDTLDESHEVAVIYRIRPFAHVVADIHGITSEVKLYKETVFTIKAAALKELVMWGKHRIAKDHALFPQAVIGESDAIGFDQMRTIENWLYSNAGDRPGVERRRIHTAIFSATVPLTSVGNEKKPDNC